MRSHGDERVVGMVVVKHREWIDPTIERQGVLLGLHHLASAGLELWRIPEGMELRLMRSRRRWWRPNR